MKKLTLLLLLLIIAAVAGISNIADAVRPEVAMVGEAIFPKLTGKALDGAAVTIPSGKGKRAVVGMAFSLKAEKDLQTWIQPSYDQFLAKHEGVFEAGNYEGEVWFIAFVGDKAALAGKNLEAKAGAKVDAELKGHILLHKGEAEPWIKALGVQDKDKPYFAVLDADGKVLSIVNGPYNEAKMDEISEKAEE